MPVVLSRADIEANLRQLEAYLRSPDASDRDFAEELIRNGRCFVVAGDGGQHLFGPSRFVGYANNTRTAHSGNDDKDGKETNPAISAVLHSEPEEDDVMEQEYREFCRRLGIHVRDYP